MRHSHTSTSVCIQSWQGTGRIRHIPRGPVWTSGQRDRHTHTDTHSLRNIYTGGHTLSITRFHARFPDPLQAAGFLQPPIYCELPPVQSEAGVNTAGDPSHFSLFINYFPSRICSTKKKKNSHSYPENSHDAAPKGNKTVLFLNVLCVSVVSLWSGCRERKREWQWADRVYRGNVANTRNE